MSEKLIIGIIFLYYGSYSYLLLKNIMKFLDAFGYSKYESCFILYCVWNILWFVYTVSMFQIEKEIYLEFWYILHWVKFGISEIRLKEDLKKTDLEISIFLWKKVFLVFIKSENINDDALLTELWMEWRMHDFKPILSYSNEKWDFSYFVVFT